MLRHTSRTTQRGQFHGEEPVICVQLGWSWLVSWSNQIKANQIIYFEQSRHTILLTFMEIDVNRHEYEHNSTNFLQFYCINNTLISVRRRQVSHRHGAFLYVIVSNHAGANSSPWNPPPGGNPRLKRTRVGATFKTYVVKTTFKLKINIKRNPLNFKSIQWNHLQAFPIWWDYPFKSKGLWRYNFRLPKFMSRVSWMVSYEKFLERAG
jgi:hypothetical protein